MSLNTQTKHIFQTVQFSISAEFSSIWPIDRTLSGITTTGHSGPGSDGNKGILCVPQSSSITGASPSNCLVPYLGHSFGESYSFAEIQSMYSAAPIDSVTDRYIDMINEMYVEWLW